MNRDLALIGAGYWGKNLARNFDKLEVLSVICDSRIGELGSLTAQYPEVSTTDCIDDVLSSSEVRKVAIAAPAEMHFSLAHKALLAGKDVFVEKPLCLTPEEGLVLQTLAEERSRVLMVGHLLQYHPCIIKIKSLLDSGRLGRLQYITSNRLNLGKIRREENALWSFAPHDISVILALLGDELPARVQCTGGDWITPGVADATLTALRFAHGVRAHVFVSWLHPYKEQKLAVVGSKAMVVFDDTCDWNSKLQLFEHSISWEGGRIPTADKAGGQMIEIPESEPLGIECQHFVDCCQERTGPQTDAAEGLRVLRVLHAAQQSMEADGRPVSLLDLEISK